MTTNDPESVLRFQPSTDEPPAPADLLTAVNLLSDRVAMLTERTSISERQTRRYRLLTMAFTVAFTLVTVFGAVQWERVTDSLEAAHANAVTVCVNGNESRLANLELWNFVIDLTEKNADTKGKSDLEKIRTWIVALYTPHDCSDLTKTYTIPPPPTL